MLTLVKEKKHMVVIATPGGDEVGVIYREPTTQEVHKYNQEAVQRKGNKVKFRHSEAQLKYGKLILKGLREGDCGAPDASGNIVPISTDPSSPNYREDWLELLEKYAPTVIIALGAHVFGGTETLEGEEDADEDVAKN
jgi:hypothetical protein